jgi:hypothetical protein
MSASHRLSVLQGQLAPTNAAEGQQLSLSPTEGRTGNQDVADRMEELMQQTEPYAVPLPEKLQPDGPWNVYRYVNIANDVLESLIGN